MGVCGFPEQDLDGPGLESSEHVQSLLEGRVHQNVLLNPHHVVTDAVKGKAGMSLLVTVTRRKHARNSPQRHHQRTRHGKPMPI